MTSSLILTPNVDAAVAQELNDGNPLRVAPPGPDLPIPAFEEQYAESQDTEGGQRVSSRTQNAPGSIPLLLLANTAAAFWAAIDNLQQTVEAIRRHKGTLRYEPDTGAAVTYDIESLRISGLPQDKTLSQNAANPVLEFTARPYGRRDPIALVVNATSALPIQSVSLPAIPGSVDALIKATFTDTSAQARDHLEIGIDTDWDGVAPCLIDSATLSVAGLAGANATRAGAYSGATNNVRRATLAGVPVGVCEATGLTHRGRHRIKARVYASGTGPYYVRAAWRIGSGAWNRSNAWAYPLDDAFSEIDLGLVRVPKGSVGTLTVRVEAYSNGLADTLDVDYILVEPTARYARLRVPSGISVPSTLVASDSFDQTAGAITGKTAAVGGVWAGAGDADDATVDATTHKLTRNVAADADDNTGRYLTLSPVVNGLVEVAGVLTRAANQEGTSQSWCGLLARYTDSDNWLMAAALKVASGPLGPKLVLRVRKRVAGAVTQIAQVDASDASDLSLLVSSAGAVVVTDRSLGVQVLSVADSALATGGALANGKTGVYFRSGSVGTPATVDNFSASVPEIQHVVNASGAITVDHESAKRSPDQSPIVLDGGRYLTCPPAGREGRTHRLTAKLRRSDVALPDDQIADGQRVDLTIVPRVSLL